MKRTALIGALPLSILLAAPARTAEAPPAAQGDGPPDAAASIVAALPAAERALVEEVLDRNPDIARARAGAEAAELRAPQARALSDPMATVTAFALTPETRVGPQRFSAALSQRLPWAGKLSAREREAIERAAAARAEADARRLDLVTETRRIVHELGFLEAQSRVIREDRATLDHYEALARARYASGAGLQQAPVRLQAEITRDDNRLLEIESRRIGLVATLNALRDRPPGESVRIPTSAAPLPELELEIGPLRSRAARTRPELTRARALLAAARAGTELAQKESDPDLTIGLGYTLVGRREDEAGRRAPPEGNGDDILGVTVGINLPVWRKRIEASIAEASSREAVATEELRAVAVGIDQVLADLVERIPLLRRQIGLFEELLEPQAREALRSVEVAYSAGSAGALDLLDAERVLLDVRISAARARADYRIALARLEGATGAPLTEAIRGDAS